MCNCGHEELEQAKGLKRRSIALLLAALFLGFVVLNTAPGDPPVFFVAAVVDVVVIASAVRLALKRRRLVCGDAL